jgi:crotonobetainyl-CoA:carnitine CoA-transferase CaiB-like acyl-CoA transferase
MSYEAPFKGLKVVDLSQGIAGPYCAMLLAQYGADVIKVESVGEGDWARTLGVRYGDHSAFSIVGNLGKRSIALDLKQEAGKEALSRLIRGADVFLEGFRPGVAKRLGVDYAAVSAREPRILYVSISGFGQTGPLAERPAMDPVLQAYTGMMIENAGVDGIPHRMPVIVVDMGTALYAFQALSAALYARRDEPRGRYIDVSLMQASAGLQSIRMMATWLEGGPMRAGGVPGGVFKTADGWMNVVAINDRDWRSLCAVIGRATLADDERFRNVPARFANEAACYAEIRPVIERMTSEELSARLTDVRVMHERLNTYFEFLDQPHVKETGVVRWLSQPHTPKPVPMPAVPGAPPLVDGSPAATAPVVGAHTREILAELGYAPGDVDGLLSSGAAAVAR